MFPQQGFQANPLLARHRNEVKRLVMVIKLLRWYEVFFAQLPTKLVFKLFIFSEEFTNSIALRMTALFLGTGNATPEAPADQAGAATKDIVSRGVMVRLSTELTKVVLRNKNGVAVRLKPRAPVPDAHNPVGGDPNAPVGEDVYDEIVLCCLSDTANIGFWQKIGRSNCVSSSSVIWLYTPTAKNVLGRTAAWKKKKVLGSANFTDDITITHSDSDYEEALRGLYREGLALEKLGGMDQTSRLSFAVDNYKPMYSSEMYPEDKSKLEMCFVTRATSSSFLDGVLQAKSHTRFAAAWTLVDAHEVAVMSGIAAAVDLGAEYPEDMERKHTKNQRQPPTKAAKSGNSWANRLYGSVYKGPGVATVRRRTWGKEVNKGRSTQSLAERNVPGRNQP
ncbi:hypothetical protein DL764_000560 [Monosporascus ibericus]|uniref:Uncharacterized protein n=1 Tax=Monosporascus ibericus TaxID=155417 RepID=A0A4Q4TY68_9PEZI|nr:hypothetical protein DL764_000560 [Monosporascus ibericus]